MTLDKIIKQVEQLEQVSNFDNWKIEGKEEKN